MDSKEALVVFEGKKIRRTWNNDEWWFVLEDIVYILTDSSDPKQYIQKLKQRDELGQRVGTNCTYPCCRYGGWNAKNELREYRRSVQDNPVHPISKSRTLQKMAGKSRIRKDTGNSKSRTGAG